MFSLSVTSEPLQYVVSKKSGVSGMALVLPIAVLTPAEATSSILVLGPLLSHLDGWLRVYVLGP